MKIFATVDVDRKTGKIADNTIEFGNEVTVNLVPPEFNEKSTIEFEVVAGGGNKFDYDIKTDYVPKIPSGSKGKGGSSSEGCWGPATVCWVAKALWKGLAGRS